ncbi:MAG: hypothetical protein HZB80_01800 [Deltaproteobacteria bacterium]|nr:hypothetical protein [Deltaproteobacteria bacterium]
MPKKSPSFKYQLVKMVCIREELFPYDSRIKNSANAGRMFKRFIGKSDREVFCGHT